MRFIPILTMLLWSTCVFAAPLCEPFLVSEEQRIADAREFMSKHPEKFSENIASFHIADQSVRVEFAKEMATHHWGEDGDESHLDEYIQNYGITDQEALVEIANLYAGHSGNISRGFKNFGILNESDRIKIAKTAAWFSGQNLVAEYFENYEIKNPRAIREILDILLANSSSEVPRYLRKFLVTSETERFQIFRSLVAPGLIVNGGAKLDKLMQRFGEFDISNPKYIYELASILATFYASEFPKYRRIFATLEEKDVVILAKIAAGRIWANHFDENFEDLNIQDEADRFEIAKISASNRQKSATFAKHFAKYRIHNPEWKIELAKLAADTGEDSEEDDNSFGEAFHNFQIEEPDVIFEIAKIYFASPRGNDSARFLANFHIESESRRVALLKLAIEGPNAYKAIEGLDSFDIRDRKSLDEIAEIVATKHPEQLAQNFEKFRIKNAAFTQKLATLAAANGMSGCALEKLGIKNKKVLLRLAYLSAAKAKSLTDVSSIFRWKMKKTALGSPRSMPVYRAIMILFRTLTISS